MKIPKFTKWLFESNEDHSRLRELGLTGVSLEEIHRDLIKRGYRTAKMVGDSSIDLSEWSSPETNWRGKSYKYDFTITDMHASPDMVRILWSWLEYSESRNRFGRRNPPDTYHGQIQCLARVDTPDGIDFLEEIERGKRDRKYQLGIDAAIEAIRRGKISRY